MRPYGSPAQLEHRRLQAVALFEEGAAPVDIARKLGVERRSVRRCQAWAAGRQVEGEDEDGRRSP